MSWQDTPIEDHSLPDVDEELGKILWYGFENGISGESVGKVIKEIKALFKVNGGS